MGMKKDKIHTIRFAANVTPLRGSLFMQSAFAAYVTPLRGSLKIINISHKLRVRTKRFSVQPTTSVVGKMFI